MDVSPTDIIIVIMLLLSWILLSFVAVCLVPSVVFLK